LTCHALLRYDQHIVSCSQERLSRCTKPVLFALGAVWLSVWASAVPARAGDVRGQLVLGSVRESAPVKPPRAAYNWELENGVKELMPTRVAAQRELAVVLLGPGSKPGEAMEVAVSGGALLPSTLALHAGTTLKIRNDDEIGHELYAQGLDGFSAEATSPGAMRSIHLTKPGNWPLLDRLAAHARAYLYVFSDLVASAKVEASGSFSFSDVPAGKYELKVLRGGSVLATKSVEVSDKPLTLDPLTLGEAKSTP
jgi:hypothetical protein